MTSTMASALRRVLLVLLALGLAACATTRFTSTWREPSAPAATLDGKRIATFVMSKSEALRRSAESVLAKELNARGVRGTAGYTLLPGKQAQNKALAKRKLEGAGVSAVVILRPAGRETELSRTPGTWYAAPYYRNWGGFWGHGWGAVYVPGRVRADTIIIVETLVYDLNSGKLLWAGRSETKNPSEVESFIEELAAAVDDELRKAGLLS